MLVLLLLVLLVSVILFIAIPFAIVGYASKNQLTLDYKKWLRIVWAFLKKRSDTKVFLAFMSIEAGLAGILPQVYLLCFETQYFNLWFEKGGNADWISFVIAVIIAYFYYLYLRRNSVYTPERWDEVVDASRIINEESLHQNGSSNRTTRQLRNLAQDTQRKGISHLTRWSGCLPA